MCVAKKSIHRPVQVNYMTPCVVFRWPDTHESPVCHHWNLVAGNAFQTLNTWWSLHKFQTHSKAIVPPSTGRCRAYTNLFSPKSPPLVISIISIPLQASFHNSNVPVVLPSFPSGLRLRWTANIFRLPRVKHARGMPCYVLNYYSPDHSMPAFFISAAEKPASLRSVAEKPASLTSLAE